MANLFFFLNHIPPKTTTLKTRSLLFCSYSQLKAAHKKNSSVSVYCETVTKWNAKKRDGDVAVVFNILNIENEVCFCPEVP